MAHSTSYPSPTQTQMAEGAHPFYSAHHQAPLPETVEMNSPAQRQGPAASGGQVHESDIFGSRDAQTSSQFHEIQNTPAPQLMQTPNQLAASQDLNLATPSGKRTKTSRACDQCRSKKVSRTCHWNWSISLVFAVALVATFRIASCKSKPAITFPIFHKSDKFCLCPIFDVLWEQTTFHTRMRLRWSLTSADSLR